MKVFQSVTSHALGPLSQTVTPRAPSSVTYFMDGPMAVRMRPLQAVRSCARRQMEIRLMLA